LQKPGNHLAAAPRTHVRFGILGPVELEIDGRGVELGGGKQRALLALLLLHANEAISRDRVIDALWGAQPPASVQQSVDTYVSRLRKLLGPDRLLRRPSGYVLVVGRGELDSEQFEDFVRTARAAAATGDPAAASSHLRAALALWRGPALADVLYEPFTAADAAQLEERRLSVLEERFDADLAGGGGPELVPELEALARKHPLRERLLGQLMTALYRAGRQADALAALQTARHRLAGELGLEPGPQLRELERQILQHDPAMNGTPRRAPLRVRTSWTWAGAPLIVAVAVAIAAAMLVVTHGGGRSTSVATNEGNRLLGIDTRSGRIAVAVGLPDSATGVAVGLGSVWAADPDGQRVVRIDPASGSVVDSIPVSGAPGRVTTGGGAVWVASTLGSRISRLDPGSGEVTQTIPLAGASATDIAYGEGTVWVADSSSRALIEIDPVTGAVRRTLPLGVNPAALTVDRGVVWAVGYDEDVVEEIDARSGRIIGSVAVGQGPSAIDAGRDAVWVANSLDGTVSRIDPSTGFVKATIAVAKTPVAIAALPASVWAVSADAGVATEIDPRRDRVVSSRRIGGRPEAIAVSGDRMWLASAASGSSHRGGTLTIVRTGRFGTIDPAFVLDTDRQFTRLAYDTLVTFQVAPGPAGLRLLPDLAVALPQPANGGTTYRFRLRAGLRYSDGSPVRARDFRRAIERLFRVGSPGASYYTGLVGGADCERRPRRCELSQGIETDEATRTVVFRLRAPDPDFLAKLTPLAFSTPIPPGVPDHDVGASAVPATGPYRIAASTGGQVRFVRNPFFHEWSQAAQPAGNPDAIVWRSVRSVQAEVDAVEHGRADWLFDLVPPAELHSLQVRYPAQLHMNASTSVLYVPLNTRRAPFDNVRVRQALNYAIDRRKLAGWFGGSLVATPLCQPLAPGLAGFRRYCPYTAHPRPDGLWSGPDLARARRLVAASGTRGDRIDVWGATDDGMPAPVRPYFAQVLRSLGYRVRLHLVPLATITPAMRRSFQLSVDGNWAPDYPAPSAYLPQFFGCHGGNGNGFLCDPALDREMARASTLELTDPPQAASLWATVDRRLVDEAAWVPFVNQRAVDFVSKRVRNYQYTPVGGFVAQEAWLR
jgi:peptide/nickel transport system substrate-binding protein